MSVVQSLVRRGVTYYTETSGEKKPSSELPKWGNLLLGVTLLVFVVVLIMVEYTFGRLLPALIMIESPETPIGFEPLAQDDTDNKDPEQVQAKPEAITSSFCRTLRLLSSLGGNSGRLRGFWILAANGSIVSFVASTLATLPVVSYLPMPFTSILASVACANISLYWTLFVISERTSRPWYRRFPSIAMWKKVAIPTAMFAIAQQVAVFAPIYLGDLVGLADNTAHDFLRMSGHNQSKMAIKGAAITILGFALAIFLVIPANVTLTRVQASLLPDTEETIVPFDRSFGGKVFPELVGGTGVVSMTDAWKTFEWAAKVRLVKAYVKLFFLQIALIATFAVVFLIECYILTDADLSKLIPGDADSGKQGL